MSEAPFCGLRLLVEPGKVMTPRPTTEALVEAAVERIAGRAALVADVGTGSGAVALAIASRAPQARVWATDTSASAVRIARANVCRHGLGDRVSVVHGDLLDGSPAGLDLVVANLPYLSDGLRTERPELAEEPPEAVFAAGDGRLPGDPAARQGRRHARIGARRPYAGCVTLPFRRGASRDTPQAA